MMAKDYDSQLLESVSVRRRRMRDALLFGAQRARRTADERLGKIFAGIAVAAVLCAGCVGWSFIQHTLAKQKEQQRQQEQRYAPVTPSPSPTPSATSTKSAHKKTTPAKTASAKATPTMSPHPKTTPAKPKGTHKVTEPAQ
ncbi:hypothetical protein GCM10010507_28200 [Streptomyces cinnamoneus]|uniref:Uncharacterized protein n=1 Tax=Streptomyces cinnamoneus TaxID=53446 RepID=A0A918TKV4_STRCJ|nr:hypothetical protein GCM10010507_28200 [Streptomyces cinnamoneus]